MPITINKRNLMGRYSETVYLSLNVSIPWCSLAKSVINGIVPSYEFLNVITSLFTREHSLPICLYKSTWAGESLYDSTDCNCYCGRSLILMSKLPLVMPSGAPNEGLFLCLPQDSSHAFCFLWPPPHQSSEATYLSSDICERRPCLP